MKINLYSLINLIILIIEINAYGTPTILDTDIGTDYDDQMALTYILSNPTIFDLKLVVCSTYNTTARAQIVAKTLSIFGRFNVPIAIGRNTGTQNMPEYEWAQNYTLDLFEKDGGTIYENGEQAFLKEIIKANRNNTYIMIEISPETSLSHVIQYIDPNILKYVRLFARAGSIYVGYGNSSQPSKEYNIVVDVHDSQIVFNSSWAYFGLAPLDTTIFMQFYGQPWLNFLSFANQSKHVQLVIDSYTTWYNNGGKSYEALKSFSPQTGTSTMYDVLAVFLAAYCPATFSMITKNLSLIITDDGYTTINSTLGKQINASIAFTTPDPYLSTQSIGTAVLNSIISG